MGRNYCEHGYLEEEDSLGRSMCSMCRALAEVYGDRREQRRYEIARDVMAALYCDGPNWDRDSGIRETSYASTAAKAADALLAALEETER